MHHTFGIDDEQPAQGHTLLLIENAIGACDVLLEVSDERVVDITKASLLPVGLNPGQVAELAIDGDAEHFGV